MRAWIMIDLKEEQISFLYNKMIPLLDELTENGDTITFNSIEYQPKRIKYMVQEILRDGSYDIKGRELLRGLRKLYRHIQE